MNKQLLTIALLAPLFSGCVAAAVGVVGGVLLSQEVMDDATYVGRVKQDVNRTWASSKTSLSHSSRSMSTTLPAPPRAMWMALVSP